MEFSKENDWARVQESKEERVKELCMKLLELKPDLINTGKGVSDLAQHVFKQHNVSAIQRVCRSDSNRIALAVGGTIINRIENISVSNVGTECGLFNPENIRNGYFTFPTECKSAKCMFVARNAVFNPTLCPGGVATEMAISVGLQEKARSVVAVEGWLFRVVADAMEVIPRTLIQNSGGNVIRVLTELRAKHANGENLWGVNGDTGKIMDMKEYGLYESVSIKIQTLKTAIEAALILLRVDDVVQAVRKEQEDGGGGAGGPPEEMMEAQ